MIARLQAADGQAVYSENYRDIHGGIPIPATLSIELGALFDNAHSDGRISYQFLSDYPFAKRFAKPLNAFERAAIETFRANPQQKTFTELQGNGLGRSTYRLATPVIMRPACVKCHNAHPDSPKRDWKVGDVRGIQEVSVRGLQVDGFGNLTGLFAYVGIVGLTSVAATSIFQRQSRRLSLANRQLLDSNQRESSLTAKLADQLQELSIFGSVVDDSVMGITIADMRKPDAPLIYVNNAFTTITGYARELAVGYNCRFLQGPDTDPLELEALRQALRNGSPYNGELINYKQDGTRFWNRLTLYPIRLGESETPDYYVANQVDITRFKEAAILSLSAITPLQDDLDTARSRLQEADEFAESLRKQFDHSEAITTETKAYLIADTKAHESIAAILDKISQVLSRARLSK